MSADDWRVLFDDGNDTSWSPTTPVGLVEEGWEPVSTSTPPTASSQQPGYATLSDVARLQRNQENTTPKQRVNQAGTSSSTQTAASSVTQTIGTPPNVHLVDGQFGRPIRRGARAAQGRSIFN